MRHVFPALGVLLFASILAAAEAPACWFGREAEAKSAKFTLPPGMESTMVDSYFRIFYSPGKASFQRLDRDGLPAVLAKRRVVLERSRHFLQTELGWKLPATRLEINRPVLFVYFVPGDRDFLATTQGGKSPYIVFNMNVLDSVDFTSHWIHQLAHASEMQYRSSSDSWLFEATAGWMELQFGKPSQTAQEAIRLRLARPDVSMNDSSPEYALGASRFLDLLSRPYRDVIRQVWERWSFSREETLTDILETVLSLNHLPNLGSYLHNFFLLSTPSPHSVQDGQELSIRPFSASVFEGRGTQNSGGAQLSFLPGAGTYSASVLFYAAGEKSGTLAMKKDLTGDWSIQVPFAGLDHYKLVLVNASAKEIRGIIRDAFDPSIPAVLEYFRVNPGDGGMQIEWKTSRENGVAFWNLYRMNGGKKERLNQLPIPAAVQSRDGIHYLYFDASAAAFYSLEALTGEGLPGVLAGAGGPR